MDVWREGICSCNRVIGEVDSDEFWSAGCSIWHTGCLGLVDRRSAGIEDPECVVWCDVESLNRDESC